MNDNNTAKTNRKKKCTLGIARGEAEILGDIVHPWSNEEIEEWHKSELPNPTNNDQ